MVDFRDLNNSDRHFSGFKFTFAVPLVAKGATRDWEKVVDLLLATLDCLLRQTDPRFEILLAGTDRPPNLPTDSRLTWIDVPTDDTDTWRDALNDAGRKRQFAAWEFGRRGGGYLMFVDADDLVSRHLVAFVRHDRNTAGYVLRSGFVYNQRLQRLSRLDSLSRKDFDFSHVCGSSVILHLSPDDVGTATTPGITRYQRLFAEGHIGFEKALLSEELRPGEIPFPAAVYLTGTGVNLSMTRAAVENADRRHQLAALEEICSSNQIRASELHGADFGLPPDPGPEPSPVRLSVCVITYRRPQRMSRLLDALTPMLEGRKDRELIVVNDGSHSEDYEKAVTSHTVCKTYLKLEKNVGIPAARNVAAKAATGSHLIYIDDDCVPPPHWLDWIEARLRTNPELDAVGGTTSPLEPKPSTILSRTEALHNLFPQPRQIGSDVLFVTANFAIRRDCFWQMGGFFEDPDFGGAGEDTELSFRLNRSVFRVAVDRNWSVAHDVGEGLVKNLKRYWRYGHGNGRLLLSPGAPAGFDGNHYLVKGRYFREFTDSFGRHWNTAAARGQGFIERLLTSTIATMIHLSYCHGCRIGFISARDQLLKGPP
ncbi:MAG TPA: glycosyltransferase [Aestuariivirga sp.]|nr:glycosyltransferase [Aestuariivirga sp.]